MLIYHRNLWYIMSITPTIETGNTDTGTKLRQRFINAELVKVGGDMDALVQRYKIADDIIEAWIEGNAWHNIRGMQCDINHNNSLGDEERKHMETHFPIIRNGVRRLDSDFADAKDNLMAADSCPTCGEPLLESNHGLCFTCSMRRGAEVHKKYANGGSS